MRVMLVSPSMDYGGAERVVMTLAAGMSERGHEVSLVAPQGPLDGEVPEPVWRDTATVLDSGRSPLGGAANTLRLARRVRERRPDVLHAHNPKVTAMAATAARLVGLRPRPGVVATLHGVSAHDYGRARVLMRGADAIACVSSDVRARLVGHGLPGSRTWVVHNAIEPLGGAADMPVQLRAGPGPVIAAVGRLVEQKNHRRLLDAAARTLEQVPEARFLILGDGPLRAALESHAARLGIASRVKFTGARGDARTIIAASDLLVFSSDWEGLSIAALEALEAGTPVLSTPVEGMRELLSSGAGEITGAATPQSLAGSIVSLLGDPPRRARMGAEGRRVVSARFARGPMLDAYEDLYRRAGRRGGHTQAGRAPRDVANQ